MVRCPICGKETDELENTMVQSMYVGDFCKVCKSYLICATAENVNAGTKAKAISHLEKQLGSMYYSPQIKSILELSIGIGKSQLEGQNGISEEIQEPKRIQLCCPNCGSERLNTVTETSSVTSGKDYSAGQGCLGYLLFGPLGFLCGLCGANKTTTTSTETSFVCTQCGQKFKPPADMRKEAQDRINAAENRTEASIPIAVIVGIFIAVISLIISCVVFSNNAMLRDYTVGVGLIVFFACLAGAGGAYLVMKSSVKQDKEKADEMLRQADDLERKMESFRK